LTKQKAVMEEYYVNEQANRPSDGAVH
jgi:hypothetical protein